MNASRASRRPGEQATGLTLRRLATLGAATGALAGALAGVLAVLPLAAALAQGADSRPRPLYQAAPETATPEAGTPEIIDPGPASPEIAPPRRLTPRRLMPEAREPQPPAAQERRGGSGLVPAPVASVELRQVDADSIGVLGPEDGGFGADLWQGLDRPQARALLRALPERYGNAALRDLARRLMLTAAPAPAGKPAGSGEGMSLLALRIGALVAMGATDDAERLLAVLPQSSATAPLTETRLDLLLLNDEMDEACALARREIDRFPTAPVRRVGILCQAREGSASAASFGLSLLRDEDLGDPYFEALVRSIGGPGSQEPDAETPERLTPLHLAALREAKTAPPDGVLESATPPVLASLASRGPGTPELRLAAALAATEAGAMSPVSLSGLFEEHGFSREELDRPISRAQELEPSLALALLYRAAKSESVRSARAEAILGGLRIGASVDAYATAARVFAPLEAEIYPSPELSWFAPAAVRLNLLVNDPVKAADWLALTDGAAADGPAARADALALDLLKTLATPKARPASQAMPVQLLRSGDDGRAGVAQSGPAQSGLAQDWAERARAADAETAPGRIVLMFTLLDALERIDPAALWRNVPPSAHGGDAPAPDAAAWSRLPVAVAANNPGETVLLSLILAGGEDPSPVGWHRALASLAAAGLGEEATLAAVEAALAAGL